MLPIFLFVVARIVGEWRQYASGRRLLPPEAEAQFIHGDQFQARAAQRAGDGGAGDLLPGSSGLLIAHDEILVVDAGEMKSQRSPRRLPLPHQTGVAERSISGDDG